MIYVIKVKDFPYYKIGVSDHLENRIHELQKVNPFDLEVIRTYQVDNQVALEHRIHKLFEDQRIRVEWFELREKDIKTIDYMVETYIPPRRKNFMRNESRKDKTNYVEQIHEINDLLKKYHIGKGNKDFYRETGIKGESRVIVANMLNMSKGNLNKILKINELQPELLARIDSGDISIHAAFNSLKR